ncbi:MAG: hypothetical protein ACRDRV_11640 [Pseudonocardiaceae bacterium]
MNIVLARMRRRWWDFRFWCYDRWRALCWPGWRRSRWDRRNANPDIPPRDYRLYVRIIRSLGCYDALARARFWLWKLRGRTRADGRHYVGWTAQVVKSMESRKGPPTGTEGAITHAVYHLSGELEHTIEFPQVRVSLPLPANEINLIPPRTT